MTIWITDWSSLLSTASNTFASQLSDPKSKWGHNIEKDLMRHMWRFELNSAGSDRTEWRTFEEMAIILWLHKAGGSWSI